MRSKPQFDESNRYQNTFALSQTGNSLAYSQSTFKGTDYNPQGTDKKMLDVIKSESEFSEKYSQKFDSANKRADDDDDFEKSDDIDLH